MLSVRLLVPVRGGCVGVAARRMQTWTWIDHDWTLWSPHSGSDPRSPK